MRKIFINYIFLLGLFGFLASCSKDKVFTKNDYSLHDGEITIVSIPDVEEVSIPAFMKVDGKNYEVTGIGGNAATAKSNLKILHLPSNIRSIGKGAFAHTALNAVYIEDLSAWCGIDFKYNVEHTNTGGHYNSHASPFSENTIFYVNDEPVTDLIIPDNVEKINAFAFNGLKCRKVIIGDNVISIGVKAFENSSLEELDMGQALEEVDQEAFYYCKNLKRIRLSPKLENAYLSAFDGDTDVEVVDSPDIQTIAFLQMGNRQWGIPFGNEYTLLIDGREEPNPVIPFIKETLPDFSLNGAKNIESIECEEGIESTGFLSFRSCESLKRIILPSTIKKVPTDFADNPGLTEIVVKSTTPPWVNGGYWISGIFEGTCVLYVPAESIDAYKSSPDWGLFKKILPLEDLPAN